MSPIEVPSNYLLSKFKKPSFYIASIIVTWGTVMTLMGIVKDFEGLVAARFMCASCTVTRKQDL